MKLDEREEEVDLSNISDVIRTHALLRNQTHSKSLGQHFLTDPKILARIVDAAEPLAGRVVLEVGPGPGGLTREILRRNPARVIAVEKDSQCVEALQDLVAQNSNLTVLERDMLTVDFDELLQLSGGEPFIVISNLPYNVGTEILIRCLHNLQHMISLTLMFQKEVSNRLLAPFGTKEYGRLSVFVQSLSMIRRVMSLPPGAFTPPPRVDSTVVHLVPKPDVDVSLIPWVECVTQVAFQGRRKMVHKSLRTLWPDESRLRDVLRRCEVDPTRRPEALSVKNYQALARVARDEGIEANQGAEIIQLPE